MQHLQPLLAINTVSALIGNNRLEPRPRTNEFNRSLRAEVRDATWLLARQWQLKEFRAEDRGVPAFAEITVETAPVTHFSRGTGLPQPYAGYVPASATPGDPTASAPAAPAITANSFAGSLPLEAQVEAQPFAITPGLRLELGAAWVRLLRKNGLGQYVGGFRQRFPLAARVETGDYDLAFGLEQTMSEACQLLRVAEANALDGYQLYTALMTNYRPVLTATGVSETGQPTAYAALKLTAEQFVACFGRLYFSQFANSPTFDSAHPTGWVVPDLAYQFAVAVPTSGTTPLVLTAPEHTAHSLEWYSLDGRTGTSGFSNAPTRVRHATTRFTPTVLRFPGAPNTRWWEFEDRQVDFGTLTGDASDLGRMLLQEFVFLYQKDWFSLPYSVPVGSLSTVQKLLVRDVFGQTYAIRSAGASDLVESDARGGLIDNDQGRWNLFGLSQQGSRRATVPRIFVPPAAVAPLVGKSLEQVLLRREEATNMVWAIEQTVPDGLGRGMDGTAAATRLTQYLNSRALPLPSLVDAPYRYQLATSVAENWIPFLPRPDSLGTYRLLQGEMLRTVAGLALTAADQLVKPRTPLLQLGDPAAEYVVHERQVPPTGLRVESAFRRARWFNGQIALWYARGRDTGYGSSNGSSGLAFDELLPQPTPPIPATPNAWYQAGVGASYDAAGNLTRWRDLSGNGLHLESINSSVYGHSTVSPEKMNGHAMVRARALTSGQQNCAIAGNDGRSVYVLGRALQDPLSPDHSQGTAFVSSGSPADGQLFECAASNGELLLHAWGSGQNNLGHLAPQPVTTPALLAWRYDGNGHSYCDFNDQRGMAGGPASLNTTRTSLNLAYGWYYQGRPADLLEVIVYNRFLTPDEDAQVRTYLGQKGNVPV